METSEKNKVTIILNLVGSPLTKDEVSLYLHVEPEHHAASSENVFSIKTEGSLFLENEWQHLRNVLHKGWDKIPQLLSQGGHIEIKFLANVNDRYPVIVMSPQIIKDIHYLKATVQMT